MFLLALLMSLPVLEHNDYVVALNFSPDSKQLISGSYDGTARVWDVSGKKEVASHKFPYLVTGVGFYKKQLLVTTLERSGPNYEGGAGFARLFSADFKTETKLKGHHVAAWYKDALFIAEGDPSQDGGVLNKDEMVLDKLPGLVCSLAVNKDYLAAGTTGGAVYTLDLRTKERRELGLLFKGCNNCLAFVGNKLAVVDRSGTVTLWTPGTLDKPDTIWVQGGQFNCVTAVSDKEIAVGLMDGSVQIWDVGSKQKTGGHNDHVGPVYAVAVSPDGKWLASGGFDGKIYLHAR